AALVSAAPAFRSERLADIDQAITNAIRDSDTPGAVLWIERNGATYHKAFGKRAVVPTHEPMEENTIFDAASLTKVIATTPAIVLLMERGKLKLEDPVRKHLPEFQGPETISLRHLLTHTSGLRSGLPSKPEWSGYQTAIAMACTEQPTNAPDSVFRYSDVNFI